CCATNAARCTSRWTIQSQKVAMSSIRRLYNLSALLPACSRMSSVSAVLTSPSVERVRQALERAGMDAEIVELPGAVFRLTYADLLRITRGMQVELAA